MDYKPYIVRRGPAWFCCRNNDYTRIGFGSTPVAAYNHWATMRYWVVQR